jgi:hypothetical protein
MSALLGEVCGALEAAGLPCAVVGAVALGLRGAPRAADAPEVATVGAAALDPRTWLAVVGAGAEIEIRRGDADDPSAGAARVVRGEDRVDVIVSRPAPWLRDTLHSADWLSVGGHDVPVATGDALVLLKLAGGAPHDREDVVALLALHGDVLRGLVDARIAELPLDAQALWRELR